MGKISISVSAGIAVVSIDNPPVNALSLAVRADLQHAIDATGGRADIKAVVLACAGRTFIAGADVREFDKPAAPPHLPDIIVSLEAARKPWVAAIHGTALGGGLEVALGCRYRVAAPTARLGMPEVLLGLIPGAGGTVRLPRLIGVAAALDMIANGKPVSAQKALSIGLIDQIADGDLLAAAIALATKLGNGQNRPPLSGFAVVPPADQAAWRALRAAVHKKAGGQLSPLAAVEAVENALKYPFSEALDKERALFGRLKRSPQSQALRSVFFAERSVSKIARLKGVTPRAFSNIGVVGGGTMGAGIAAACLLSGLNVAMVERDRTRLDAGRERVLAILQNSHDRGLISDDELQEFQNAFSGAPDYGILSGAGLIIEAVYEDMNVKRDVFARVEAVAAPDAVLATNTSYLDVTGLASAVSDPGRVLGLHFFAPAHIMKLLEVIHTPLVTDDVLATGFAFARRLGKIAVPSGVCDGFIANRMMSAYRREAEYMIEDGALPQQVDAAMVAFGFPMGIFAMQDLAGLDIGWAMRKRQAATRRSDIRYVDIADQVCEMGRFGRKTGAGWYDYAFDAKGAPDPVVGKLIIAASARNGITRREFTAGQIMARILSAMQREGRELLDEGIATSQQAIDVAMINGFGFPRWRGGPMYMGGMDQQGGPESLPS